ncbi:RnfABCDGE type electron transport complex subunit C [Dethiosulfatarculus sandiegensis]|uniref:4Fe-4S ferredoxin-type domain-containing protein n=1 Tax=Dethiosulfatarculus sandiegensis TaxID=1429043 RepID=A0A0D2J9Q6_9BACT|nr:RnfABCDGE type electron transport complex subunit C [Dethiosulfatarculus sandiegensis]KIX14879.1 hypothetical protein X474_06955 [Dethiosulfatarculus sandiegensis]
MKIEHLFKGVRRRPPNVSPPAEIESVQRVFLPLQPGVKALVEAGQEVAIGQLVGASEDSPAQNVHASVSGTVAGVEMVTGVAGQPVNAVAIINDGKNTMAPAEDAALAIREPETLVSHKPLELAGRLDQAGFDISATVGPKPYISMNGVKQIRKIDYLIISAVDYDPPVAPNQASLADIAQEELVLGISALVHVSGAKKVKLAIPKGGVSKDLEKLAYDLNWEMASVAAGQYPFAWDNLLINQLTGREVFFPEGDSRDWGAVVVPLPKVLELARCLMTGKPATTCTLAVSGDVNQPKVLKAPCGTPVKDLLEACGGVSGDQGKVILGGPMKGQALFDLDMPVTKDMDGLFVQSAEKMAKFSDHPCIHCGRCVQVCPVNLIPGELGKLCEYNQFEEAADKDLFQCIECGACAYVCPARRPLVQLFQYGKAEIQAERMEQ